MREFIVEADGGSRGNPGPAGYGSVVLDAVTGETLVEAAEYIGVATNNVAEYRGLIAGLKAAYELDPEASVRVRMDSKLVVEQLSGRWKIKHPDMKPLAAEAARVFPPGRVTYEWMPREQNKHADRLANEAMDAGKRGEQWSPAASTADLDTRASRSAAAAAPEPSGPPGDATAGAALARAALAGSKGKPASTGGRTGTDSSGGGRSAGADSSDGGRSAEPPSDGGSRSAGARTPGTGDGSRSTAHGPRTTADGPRTTTTTTAVDATSAAAADLRAAKNVASVAPDLGTPATFVLLRHGETPLTPQKRFSGSGGSDPSLSEVGRYQAERVAAALAARGTIQEVVSSPLARCRETAGIVATRLGLGMTVEDGLRETDFGAWEGLSFGEVRERYPDDMNAWLASPDAEPTGGGESFAAVAHRVAATRDALAAAHRGRTVLLVSHVTPIKTLVRLALGAPPESLFRMELSAASLSALAYYADGNATLRLLNDTSHLR
ncbi:bifunctional RNase H/acid phosphatase [Streptomyces scabiei]|uniref:bifunctional RNase H/acid phosphatase n=2 Tax=Streptomyces scabiei TaxID=1930 RepID=UPI001B31084C|nr:MULTISPECIES: bifunctional RNase H/acid phosphatase [Streptomyces]MBP5866984.1 bifunctional RNase H/acid phosphatase [Streptomyces sp. LBUM 1485]MBP5917251.1 bifunctional RNase H/acid phosphatase [Streptomyces sp. LBUM 1486]MDX3033994.1 bifunctional RNase H/acid phosphatase [Streptomyces scabiei]MDX3212682.1 bifunctional RNase H/acid phosphatase [Streptomyces scabiei]QTU53628.1 bifunctional RNase H/acid phosphatase [Streptomyces sp. LBUM 1480]